MLKLSYKKKDLTIYSFNYNTNSCKNYSTKLILEYLVNLYKCLNCIVLIIFKISTIIYYILIILLSISTKFENKH